MKLISALALSTSIILSMTACRYSQRADTAEVLGGNNPGSPETGPKVQDLERDLDPKRKVSGVEILFPQDNQAVVSNPFVEGLVEDPEAVVALIVHPLTSGQYWVQERITVKEVGSYGYWKLRAYIGDSQTRAGTQFEIMAVADPKKPLTPGTVLNDWPAAKWKSKVIYLSRK